MTEKLVNELRYLSAQTIHNANSGHTGVALGAAPIFYALLGQHLVFDPKNPKWEFRDRLVLSAGHASALLYSVMHLFDMGIDKQDLLGFRKVHSKTPGHPEIETDFIESNSGPLGQGIAMGVGMAIAEEWNRAQAKTPPLFTYVFHGDGCLMEGVALEAISLAGSQKLQNLIMVYDYNQITIDGKLDLSNKEHVKNKFISQGWRVIEAKDGNSVKSVSRALLKARKQCGKPTIVICPTTIGFGSLLQGSAKIHGVPLTKEELIMLKNNLKVEADDFSFSPSVKQFALTELNKRLAQQIKVREGSPATNNNQEQADTLSMLNRALNTEPISMSGRDASSLLLNQIGNHFPNLIGGTADLVPSVKAYLTNGQDFGPENRKGRNIRYGVREHAMAAIANGIALFGKNQTFVSTFFVFSNYMMPAMRMSALMQLPVTYIFTHDSVFAGEDGPTHQPVEHLGSLRLMPNIYVIRPCDMHEIQYAWKLALTSKYPTCIVLAKQTLPLLNSSAIKAEKGGYFIKEAKKPEATILATGSEVQLAVIVAEQLEKENIVLNVVSMPCLEVFAKQTAAYKQKVLGGADKPKFVIEASNDNIWHKYVQGNGLIFGVNQFGKSGKGEDVYALFYQAQNIANEIKKFLQNRV